MRIARFSWAGAAIGLLLAPTVVRGQALPIDLELGYRFLDVSGSEETYRTQINERPGFVLRAFSLSTADLSGGTTYFDQLRINAADVGAGPAGAFRLQVGRHGDYLLRFAWRHSEPFSALAGFANPLMSQGVLVGQHTWDRKRNQFDVDLELLPGRVVTPIVGYSSNLLYGPGQTTYRVGEDEFRLQQDVRQSDQEVRAGVAFDAGPVSGHVLQGWRKYHATETLTLVPGAGAGNNPGPVLGQDQSLATFTRTSPTDVNTPTTHVFVRGLLNDHFQVSAFYMHANASGSASDQESLTGSLVSFQILRFFQGLQQSVSSRVDNAYWRAGGKIELRLTEGVDVLVQYTQRHSELDGEAIIDSLFLGTTTFTGIDPKDLKTLLNAQTLVERTDGTFETRLSAKGPGPFAVYGGFSLTKQDVTVAEDASEIVIPGGQSGDFARRINVVNAGLSFSMQGVSLGVDARLDDADQAILRTDYTRRTRVRARATFKPVAWAEIGGTGEWTNQTNVDPGIGYDGSMRNYTASLQVTPVTPVRLHGAYSKFKSDSTIPIRIPHTFGVADSVNAEDGDSWEAGAAITWAPVSVDGSWGRLENAGTSSYTIDRARVRVDVDVTMNAGLVGEWAHDRYRDTPLPASSFTANRYGVYLRWRP